MPAEYGLRTAGIIDVQTKTGLFDPGGQISMYGGSHSELNPSFDYGGSDGNLNYFVSGDYLTNTLASSHRTAVSTRCTTAPSSITALPSCRTFSTRTRA